MKDANLETIWGAGGKKAVLYTIFPSKKNPVLWAMLYVVYVGCGFFKLLLVFFFFNGEGRVFVYVAQITHVCLYI